MHEQDDEADGGADEGDDDAGLVDGAVGGRRGGGAGVVGTGDVVVAVVGGGVPPEIRLAAQGCQCARGHEGEPEQEIAGHVGAGVDGAVAGQEHEYVGDVPDDGEAEADDLPGEEPEVVVVGGVVVGVSEIGVDVVDDGDLVGEGPADEADADDGENDAEGAEDVFPEEFWVVGVHLLAGGTDGEHDWGTGDGIMI